MKKSKFYPQVTLLLDVLPYIAKEECFALKGGTAINLFVRNFPRLSVDADLTYLGSESRTEALFKTQEALLRIKDDIENHIGAKVTSSSRFTQTTDIKLFVHRGGVQIKIEANPVLRGVLFPVKVLPLQSSVSEEFEREFEIQVSSLPDLYGGKIAAALDRQHPRDLFDVKLLLENEGISRDIVTGFLVYLMCHRRPPHELLKPTLKDQSKLFNSDFEGMTNTVFKYKDFLETRDILINKINTNLNSEDKIFLISFFEGNPTWSLFRHPSAQNLPAIKWKLENLNKNGLETKRNAQLELLRSIF
ncbi:MAG: nucleotidyl transferase AbiEii/AbiGii toxin family protein [Pseudobdellovibrionaceae bacterium]